MDQLNHEKIIEYYLTSDEWKTMIDMLMDEEHCCKVKCSNSKIFDVSDVYLKYIQKLNDEYGGYFISLSDTQFTQYFERDFSEVQRFCALWGTWWGFSPEQVEWIVTPKKSDPDFYNVDTCFLWLNYFMCHDSFDIPDDSFSVENFKYNGKYHRIRFLNNADAGIRKYVVLNR